MRGFFADMSVNPFLLTGLLAGALGGLSCGTLGPYVVSRRLVFLAGALAHVAVGGVGAAIFLATTYPDLFSWLSPLHGAGFAALAVAPVLALLQHRGGESIDTAIGALWAGGMALGILLIKKTPGYHGELMGYLFGNLAYVSWSDVYLLLGLTIAVLLVLVIWHRRFLALCVDPEQARLQGVSPLATDIVLLFVVALTVTALTRVVGLILVIALVSLPASTALRFQSRLAPTLLLSGLLGVLLTTLPRIAAYGSDFSPEAAIVLTAVIAWLAAGLIARRRTRSLPKASSPE
ncbi:MAG: metal ABC transporter permease [Acidobacteriota bacterium]